MNKSQKGALFVLVMAIILFAFMATIPFAWFNEAPVVRMVPLFFFVLVWTVMGLSIIFFRRRQSPCEVDYDERDIAIKQKAIFASYITIWTLVLMGSIAPAILYEKGVLTSLTMLVNILPVAVFLVFIIVAFVYSLMVLIQYGRDGK